MSERPRRTRRTSALVPLLERVNHSVGPLAYLDIFECVAFEMVSPACRGEVRAPTMWRQLVIPNSSKQGRLVNETLAWLCGNERLSCTSLTSLDLKDCRNLTDESIRAVAAGCSSLTSLIVSGCENLTDESIKAVAAGCSSLTSLNIKDLSLIHI